MRDVLRQARLVNPSTPILLLGDAASIALAGNYAECFDLGEYAASSSAFLEAYVHLSRTPREFTRNTIARWFALRDFCRSRGVSNFVHADSDVLLFASADKIAARLERAVGRFDVALSLLRDPVSACGHAALWWNGDRLDEFCAMVEDIYTLADAATFLELVAFYHLPVTSGVHDAGLVSDMTLLGIFKRRSAARIVDSGAIHEGATLDHNINLAEQDGRHFVMVNGMKHMTWRDGMPHGVLENGGELVRFDTLHFQGRAKRHISTFTRLLLAGTRRQPKPWHPAQRTLCVLPIGSYSSGKLT